MEAAGGFIIIAYDFGASLLVCPSRGVLFAGVVVVAFPVMVVFVVVVVVVAVAIVLDVTIESLRLLFCYHHCCHYHES